MTFGRFLSHSVVILGLSALMACSSPEPADSPEDSADATAAIEVAAMPDTPSLDAADTEGSEAKSDADGADAVAKLAGEVDNSIRSAEKFGDDSLLAGLIPEGWKQAGDIEHYNVAALYNKINGRSELYMAYDVRGLSWVSFVKENDPANFLDLFVYDMQTPTGAFGIFSVEREAGQERLDLGRDGYRTDSNYYFMQGKRYGYINASQKNEDNTNAGIGILTALMQRLDDDGSPVVGLDWLPQDGLIRDTVQYFKVDAMSLDFLTETFLGQYEFGDDTARLFVSKRGTAEEAAEIVKSFDAYGTDYADGVSTFDLDGTEIHLVDWGGDYFDVMFQVGSTVAGLSNVEGRERAERVLKTLIPQLQ